MIAYSKAVELSMQETSCSCVASCDVMDRICTPLASQKFSAVCGVNVSKGCGSSNLLISLGFWLSGCFILVRMKRCKGFVRITAQCASNG